MGKEGDHGRPEAVTFDLRLGIREDRQLRSQGGVPGRGGGKFFSLSEE